MIAYMWRTNQNSNSKTLAYFNRMWLNKTCFPDLIFLESKYEFSVLSFEIIRLLLKSNYPQLFQVSEIVSVISAWFLTQETHQNLLLSCKFQAKMPQRSKLNSSVLYCVIDQWSAENFLIGLNNLLRIYRQFSRRSGNGLKWCTNTNNRIYSDSLKR